MWIKIWLRDIKVISFLPHTVPYAAKRLTKKDSSDTIQSGYRHTGSIQNNVKVHILVNLAFHN